MEPTQLRGPAEKGSHGVEEEGGEEEGSDGARAGLFAMLWLALAATSVALAGARLGRCLLYGPSDGAGGARLGCFGHLALERSGAWLDACEDLLDAYAPAASEALRAAGHARATAALQPRSLEQPARGSRGLRRRVRSCPPQCASAQAADAGVGASVAAACQVAASA